MKLVFYTHFAKENKKRKVEGNEKYRENNGKNCSTL